ARGSCRGGRRPRSSARAPGDAGGPARTAVNRLEQRLAGRDPRRAGRSPGQAGGDRCGVGRVGRHGRPGGRGVGGGCLTGPRLESRGCAHRADGVRVGLQPRLEGHGAVLAAVRPGFRCAAGGRDAQPCRRGATCRLGARGRCAARGRRAPDQRAARPRRRPGNRRTRAAAPAGPPAHRPARGCRAVRRLTRHRARPHGLTGNGRAGRVGRGRGAGRGRRGRIRTRWQPHPLHRRGADRARRRRLAGGQRVGRRHL
ncbi:MAG: Similar to 1,4-dihydroxy-2-naphthoate octaprenyltransferase, partial [uncultured Nocardioidaceae bacterium]